MKKETDTAPDLEMASEYDFSRGIRGKYVKRFPKGSKIDVVTSKVAAKITKRSKRPARGKGNRG
jgi:hypothetical protein